MNIKLRLHEYSDAAFVQGVKNQDPVIQKEMLVSSLQEIFLGALSGCVFCSR